MALALFDLDNTLLAGDSDYEWGQFLIAQGVVDGERYEQENRRFYADYQAGTLDIHAFARFSFQPLAAHPLTELKRWRAQFIAEHIRPLVLNKAQALLNRHRDRGDTLIIITSTNAFVTAPIAELLEVAHLIATEPECIANRYTGRIAGIPCFQAGKVARLNLWLKASGETLAGSHFYSDSHNDLPLLEAVDHPIAVDPDEILAAHAQARGWPIMLLRD